MRDLDVRTALRRQLRFSFENDPNTRIIEELGLCQGSVRIDVAVANCALHGYEIKSAADTLARLPVQSDAYSKVFDFVTLVTADRHLAPIFAIIPDWWGIIVAQNCGTDTTLEPMRNAEPNPSVDAYSIAQLLWRNEVFDILVSLRCSNGVKSKSREHLWQRLVEVLSIDELRECARRQIKARQHWRPDEPSVSGDVLSPSVATPLSSHALLGSPRNP